MFGNSDSVFDFDPFEVGNWMTLGMMEEAQEEDDEKEEEDEWDLGTRSQKKTETPWWDM